MNSKRHTTLSVFNNKSSVLCPNSTHITSQYLALEQLKAHHNMVSHAKGTVDTSAPKSLQSYLSSIDRKKKSYWHQDGRLSSHSGLIEDLSHTLQFQRERQLAEHNKVLASHDDTFSTSLNKSIQAGIPFPQFQSKVADKISWYLEAVSQGVFQETARPCGLRNNSQQSGSSVSLSSSLRSGKVIKGDLMEWHKKSFTPAARPFSPRILINNQAKSKVLSMRCYNPPQKRKECSSTNSSEASTFESYEEEEKEGEQESEPDEEEKVKDEVEEEVEDDEIAEEIKTEEPAADDTHVKGGNSHREWLSEQALRAQIRRKLSNKTNTSKRSILAQNHGTSGFERLSHRSLLSRNEEDKHIKFLSDVTEDILRSGIYSDSAIQRTCDFHLQFCSDETEKEKMKHMLDQILEGLSAPCEDYEVYQSLSSSPTKDTAQPTNTALKKKTAMYGSEENLPTGLQAVTMVKGALQEGPRNESVQSVEDIEDTS